MLGSSILEMAIGLIFIYSLLALICSAIKESLENWLNKRAADLERGIREMFKDPTGTGLTKVFFDHPIICCLYKGWYKPEGTGLWARIWRWLHGGNLPSYIPSSNVADAILDIVRRSGSQESWDAPQADGIATTVRPTLQQAGDDRRPLTMAVISPTLREAIENIPNPQVKQVFRAIVDSVGEDIDKVKKELENWFNSSMERVSGWYKRWTQTVIFVVGVLLVVGLNADTIAIASALSKDKELRSRVVLAAEQFEKDRQSRAKSEAKSTGSEDSAGKEIKDLKEKIKKMDDLGLPLGWESQPENLLGWVEKILGLLMTSFAISLGAQFWFDTLTKVTNIRSTLKTDEKK